MRILQLVFIMTVLLIAGCGGSAPTAPDQDELNRFLADNPDVANAEEMDMEDEEE